MDKILPWLLVFGLAAPGAALNRAYATGEGFDVTSRYQLVLPPQPTQTRNKVEVLDVFWYGCPHCYHFLPYLESYARHKPPWVAIRHMPAIFNATWKFHARIFYAAKLLGVEERLHRAIFEEIHERGDPLTTRSAVFAFFASRGVDRHKFAQVFDSPIIDKELRDAEIMQNNYSVQGTPTVFVNGKYRLTGSLAGGYGNLIKVIKVLTKKEHQEMMNEPK